MMRVAREIGGSATCVHRGWNDLATPAGVILAAALMCCHHLEVAVARMVELEDDAR